MVMMSNGNGIGDDNSLLEEAQGVVEDRENVHGSVYETHAAIADLLEVFMRHKYGVEIEVSAGDAADLLDMCLKDARKLTGETNRDTYRDGAGYNYCGWICRQHESDTE